MSKPLTQGQRVRIIPREGTVVQVRPVTLKQRKLPNGRYEPTVVVHRYLIELDDGWKVDVSGIEIEEMES